MHLLDLFSSIKKRRLMLRVTQETLAELSGVGLRTLKQLESGRGNPTFETVRKITDVLGMELIVRVQTKGNN